VGELKDVSQKRRACTLLETTNHTHLHETETGKEKDKAPPSKRAAGWTGSMVTVASVALSTQNIRNVILLINPYLLHKWGTASVYAALVSIVG
jgi:hypothetical protein